MTLADFSRDTLETSARTLRLQLTANRKIFPREEPQGIAHRLGIIVTLVVGNWHTAEHPRFEKDGANYSRFSGKLEDAVIRTGYFCAYAQGSALNV